MNKTAENKEVLNSMSRSIQGLSSTLFDCSLTVNTQINPKKDWESLA